ncbi:Secreted protein [Globisporangium polare]
MARWLFCLAAAALALSASSIDARVHIQATVKAAGTTTTASVSGSNASSGNSAAAEARKELTGQVVGSSIVISNSTLTTCTPHSWSYSQPGAPFVSVHFAKFHIIDGDVVTIATPDGSTSKQVAVPPGTGGVTQFSSDRIPGPTAVVTFTPKGCLDAQPLPAEFKLEIDAFQYTYKNSYSAGGEDREICGAGDQNKAAVCYKKAANVSSKVYKNALAVARLMKTSGPGEAQIACTGFLLGSAGHLMTNHHCIKDATEANNTNFEFMVESPTCDNTTCRQLGECAKYGTVESYGSDFVVANEKYDFAIVKLRKKPCVVNGKYGYLQLRKAQAVKGEPIYLVQHPSGGGKMVVMQQEVNDGEDDEDDDDETAAKAKANSTAAADQLEQAVVSKLNDENAFGDFWTSYFADTEGGSSGSPVISMKDHLVLALHANSGCENSGTPSNLIIDEIKKNTTIDLPDDAFA